MIQHHSYRVLKSTWGIAIDLTADLSFPTAKPDGGTPIMEGLWLSIKSPSVTEEDKKWLITGLNKINKILREKILVEHSYVVITILNLDISWSDFQPEGLADAIIRWSEKVFGLNIPETKISFDVTKNKYVYDFSLLVDGVDT